MDSNSNSQSILTARATKVGNNRLNNASFYSQKFFLLQRKLDDAFLSLDDAVGSKESLTQSSPNKKPFTARSIYSTLTKYGIKTKNTDSSSKLVQLCYMLALSVF